MKDKSKRFQWGVWSIVVCALLVSYPLSFGPAILLLRSDYLHTSVVVAIYKPLVQIADNSPKLVEDMLLWSYRVCDGRDP